MTDLPIVCPHCGEIGPQVELTLNGKIARHYYCQTCGKEFCIEREPQTDISGHLIDGP